jgi:hypothetical protein
MESRKQKKRIAELEFTQLEPEEIEYTLTPVGRALYNGNGRPPKDPSEKAKPTDRVICDICGGQFTRWNRSKHNVTKVHKLHVTMNQKLKKILID